MFICLEEQPYFEYLFNFYIGNNCYHRNDVCTALKFVYNLRSLRKNFRELSFIESSDNVMKILRKVLKFKKLTETRSQ